MIFAQPGSPIDKSVRWQSSLSGSSREDVPQDNDKDDHGHHDGDDDDYEAQNLSLQSCHAVFGLLSQFCDAAKNSAVSNSDHDANGTARNTVCPLQTDAVCLKIVVICRLNCAAYW